MKNVSAYVMFLAIFFMFCFAGVNPSDQHSRYDDAYVGSDYKMFDLADSIVAVAPTGWDQGASTAMVSVDGDTRLIVFTLFRDSKRLNPIFMLPGRSILFDQAKIKSTTVLYYQAGIMDTTWANIAYGGE